MWSHQFSILKDFLVQNFAIPAKVVPPGEPFCCVLMALQCSKCDETGLQSSDEMLELSSSRGMAHA